MKRFLFIIVLSIMVLDGNIYAVPACPNLFSVIQQDSTLLQVQLHGDEFSNWMTTSDGYVIGVDSQHAYRYLVPQGDNLVFSEHLAHNSQERDNAEVTFLQRCGDMALTQMKQCQLSTHRNQVSAIQTSTNTSLPVKGARRILTILVEFPDKPFTKKQAEFDHMINQIGYNGNDSKGSVRDFYRENSNGQLDVVSTIIGPIITPHLSSHYAGWVDGAGKFVNHKAALIDLIWWALDEVSDQVNFSHFDGNLDGVVDGVQIIFAGFGRADNPNGIIWPHSLLYPEPLREHKTKFQNFCYTPELDQNGDIAAIGTMCHELGHVFGAWDFYDTDKGLNGLYYATGDYDLMCNGSWNNNGKCPAHFNPYVKSYVYGWLNPQIITAKPAQYHLSPTISTPAVYRINTHTEGEYFLLENRAKMGFDAHIPCGGLVVYHIHKDMNSNAQDFNNAHPLKCYALNAEATTNPNINSASYGASDSERAFPGEEGQYMFLTSTSIPSLTAWDGSSTGTNLSFIRQNGNYIDFMVNSSPAIEGSPILCKEEMYYLDLPLPSGVDIQWSYSTNIQAAPIIPVVTIISDADDPSVVTVTRGYQMVSETDDTTIPTDSIPAVFGAMPNKAGGIISYKQPYVGEVTLKATINAGGESHTLSKKLTLPANIKPRLNTDPAMRPLWEVGQTFSFTELNCGSIPEKHIKWYVQHPVAYVGQQETGRTIYVTPRTAGTIKIRVVNECGCETKNESTYSFYVREPLVQLSYANPANTNTLSVRLVVHAMTDPNREMALSEQVYELYDNPDNKEYTIELWSDILGKIKSITTTESQIGMDIAGLPDGWYQVLLTSNGEYITTGNLKINH